jgi:hypothetical protein
MKKIVGLESGEKLMKTSFLIALTVALLPHFAYAKTCKLRVDGLGVTYVKQEEILKQKNWQIVSKVSVEFDATAEAQYEIETREKLHLFYGINQVAEGVASAKLSLASTGEQKMFSEEGSKHYRWRQSKRLACNHPSPGAGSQLRYDFNYKLMDQVINALPACNP